MRQSFALLMALVVQTMPLDAFNRAFADATRSMSNAATLALWADDGVSLLPNARPRIGKRAIASFLDSVTTPLAGSRMITFELRCFDERTSGTWASEWCVEHQVVRLPGGRTFDGWGKMALVLHRDGDNPWHISQEMWIPASAADSVLLRPVRASPR